jgi:hypothetical protein
MNELLRITYDNDEKIFVLCYYHTGQYSKELTLKKINGVDKIEISEEARERIFT